ncbi:hypothetical protein NN3_00430 [Nocardia neocaledoniensis NBRC 108232]|uniref:Uncharacterized protein n=1 Tax=Nocardia neocaledoniensis TaxID=236511 RepID=A0A317NLF0_9NOCA|nr:hypothetical protein [Nocardia neocaledoniensis]PWV74468.1 hypothetical protein DFR69_106279 [Nocardia neocaledoniensis]GEM29036.1 hypothetical protein NN3_00430 [Nocardia neocaledoniensis NBRC 108232]
MIAAPLPAPVLAPLTQLLNWLAWFVLLLCVARAIFVGGQLAVRIYREEAIEGFIGSLAAAALLGMASALAIAILPTT